MSLQEVEFVKKDLHNLQALHKEVSRLRLDAGLPI